MHFHLAAINKILYWIKYAVSNLCFINIFYLTNFSKLLNELFNEDKERGQIQEWCHNHYSTMPWNISCVVEIKSESQKGEARTDLRCRSFGCHRKMIPEWSGGPWPSPRCSNLTHCNSCGVFNCHKTIVHFLQWWDCLLILMFAYELSLEQRCSGAVRGDDGNSTWGVGREIDWQLAWWMTRSLVNVS